MRGFKGECAHFSFLIFSSTLTTVQVPNLVLTLPNRITVQLMCTNANVLHCKQCLFPTYFFLNFIYLISYFHLIDSPILHIIYFLDPPPSKYYPLLHLPPISDIISFSTRSYIYILPISYIVKFILPLFLTILHYCSTHG